MSRTFSYDLSVPGPPAEAKVRVRDAVTNELRRSANMQLTREESDSLAFGPKWTWPLLVAVSRKISGDTVKLNFSNANGDTQVAVSGKVTGVAEKVASREFWVGALATT